eukprot:TRINITY_DN52046_c0_g1_i1.p1 TRINITY_DN52046_c0_g1~~TRINITY_DN52046_c0_g1_i1.p1  ORF type:complete len:582 (+),score=122.30 TRINITY_DN52046_c0_g1_i1:176-1921(+)
MAARLIANSTSLLVFLLAISCAVAKRPEETPQPSSGAVAVETPPGAGAQAELPTVPQRKASAILELGAHASAFEAAAIAAAAGAAKSSHSKEQAAPVAVVETLTRDAEADGPAAAASESVEAPPAVTEEREVRPAPRLVSVAVNMQNGGRHISFSQGGGGGVRGVKARNGFVSPRAPIELRPDAMRAPVAQGAMQVSPEDGVFQPRQVASDVGSVAGSGDMAAAAGLRAAASRLRDPTDGMVPPESQELAPDAGASSAVSGPVSWISWLMEALFAIGGGTGATIGGTGDPALDQDMVRRMRYQDKAVMLFLMLAYTGSLAFSANIAYRQACNTSPVTYYADPRYHNMVVDSSDMDGFLEAFNQPPKEVQLQVTGFVPLQDPEFAVGNVDWYGMHYHVAFSFALDLSPWVVRCGVSDPSNTYQYGEDFVNSSGINPEDMQTLRDFLQHNSNDLAIMELQKEVIWNDWEELAMNIKHRIRQAGFGGIISVHRSESEVVPIYKNKAWANFMHSRTTKVLWALSLIGWLFYQPYMWLRCTSTPIRSRYRIDIPIAQYWPFIEDKIGPDGFNDRVSQNGQEPAVVR